MNDVTFDDLRRARDAHRVLLERRRRRVRPLIPLLRAALAGARAAGVERRVFLRRFRPVVAAFNDRARSAFTGYEPTAHDVLVCSYFKSGTHWAMQIAHQIAHRGGGDYASIYDVIPWPDGPRPDLNVALTDPRPLAISPTGLRVIKTHAPAGHVPWRADAKYLCVVRDPKDVFVSSYHFIAAAMLGPLRPSVDTWLSLYLSDDAFCGPWPAFTASYWPWRDRPNVRFLTYEQMQADKPAVMRMLAEFLGVDLTADELAQVGARSDFAYMQAHDHKYHQSPGTPFSAPGGQMIRAGRRASAGELLTRAQQTRVDDWCRARLAALGSDFPYDDFYAGAAARPPAPVHTAGPV